MLVRLSLVQYADFHLTLPFTNCIFFLSPNFLIQIPQGLWSPAGESQGSLTVPCKPFQHILIFRCIPVYFCDTWCLPYLSFSRGPGYLLFASLDLLSISLCSTGDFGRLTIWTTPGGSFPLASSTSNGAVLSHIRA